MKNGLIKIESFLLLDRIAEKHRVKDKDWAPLAGLAHGSRISELRACAQKRRIVEDRAFHFQKFIALKRALESILGEKIVRKELSDLLDKATDRDEKLVLLASLVPEDRKQQAIEYLELIVQATEKEKE